MVTRNPTSEQDEKVSVPGFTEEEIAHLSPGQRRKLAAERSGGQQASENYQKALEHNKRLVEQSQKAEQEASGGYTPLDPETITAQRVAEQKMANERAREQQAINYAANVAKEAADHNEMVMGRDGIPQTLAQRIDPAAEEVATQRLSQAEDATLGAGQATHGHPANSEQQADAVMANTQKELADRVESGTVQQPVQGYGTEEVSVRRVPVFDNDGTFMGTQVGDKFEPDPDYDGGEQPPVPETYEPNTDPNVGVRNTEHQTPGANPPPIAGQQPVEQPQSPADNGQPMQTSEPDAAAIAAGLMNEDDGGKKGKGKSKKPASTNTTAVGTGPVSE